MVRLARVSFTSTGTSPFSSAWSGRGWMSIRLK